MGAFEPKLQATADEPRKYYLVTKSNSWKGGPMFFGAVMLFKGYVSYHLSRCMHVQNCRRWYLPI
jgi:hypothetical protein